MSISLSTLENTTYTESAVNVTLEADEESKIPNTVLIAENINMTNRGEYKCLASSDVTGESAESITMVRIKGNFSYKLFQIQFPFEN